MLIFDQLKKNDPQLRFLAALILCGLFILLAGLWWVQIVSRRDYQANLETQSFRTVRIPAVRGQIQDRNGAVLAENVPVYNLSLYLEDLRKPFDAAYLAGLRRARVEAANALAQEERRLGRSLSKVERRKFSVSLQTRRNLGREARYEVVSNLVAELGKRMQVPITLDPDSFERHYLARRALPFPVIENITPLQIAKFQEQCAGLTGLDIDTQSTRYYPGNHTAAHVLGYLRRDNDSREGEEAFFSYRLPDFRGVVGIEAGYDKQLRGMAGAKSVLVNNMGYRQTENIWSPASPGKNVVLTIDLAIQHACEVALRKAEGAATRGAAVVMDVITGDILAMASSPSYDPNDFVRGMRREEWDRLTDPTLRPQLNRATQENYAPGSIFKPIVGLAALEAGLDPNQLFRVEPDPAKTNKGCIFVGREKKEDTAPPGDYNFRRALKLSSNSYFITNGIRAGVANIIRLGERLHLGERTGLPTRQEVSGYFPDQEQVSSGAWRDGHTANLCIGQGTIDVTPLQMTVMTSALANGGTVLWPRLVDRLECPDPTLGEAPVVFPKGRVRDRLDVRTSSLRAVHEAMLADVEDPDGTGRDAAVPGLRICGKTGTAQKQNQQNRTIDHITWFSSFAPYGSPKYAVVVMVESGVSGGKTCAPVAKEIYTALLDRERRIANRTVARTR